MIAACNDSCSASVGEHQCDTIYEILPSFSLTGLKSDGADRSVDIHRLLTLCLHPIMSHCGSGNQAHAHAPSL